MPVVSDFSIVTKHDFVTRSTREFASYTFNTGGRRNTDALIDVALLGGFRSGDDNQSVRIRLNGTILTTAIVERWQTHATLVLNRINVVVEPGILRDGNNTLRLEPLWEGPSDYVFVGPIVCHFHQSA